MTNEQDLLDAAREYCDQKTGEVLERIPEELMRELRAAGLARGIPGKPSRRTGSSATWFVFLNGQIEEEVLARRRRGKGTAKSPGKEKAPVGAASGKPRFQGGRGAEEGLGRFVKRKGSRD